DEPRPSLRHRFFGQCGSLGDEHFSFLSSRRPPYDADGRWLARLARAWLPDSRSDSRGFPAGGPQAAGWKRHFE
ncbi:hypothetical protein LH612_30240, partial [Klebsiella pneumoniae]|nr:hypothetical protein [Klebsiella pneumoniae]